MIDKVTPSRSGAPEEDAKALLARLYREIGISAVAAALEATAFGSNGEDKPTASTIPVSSGSAEKKGLAA